MSARSKKTTTTTTTTSSKVAADVSTPVTAAHTGTPGSRSMRSPSPTMAARIQEKNDLAALNNRLAAYIERVRHLEGENSRLTQIITAQEDAVSSEMTKIKGLYEDELANARRLLDELAKEKAKLQVEVGRLKSELDEIRARLIAKEKESADRENRLIASEARVNELQARFNDSINEKRRWEEEFNKLKKEFDAVTKSLAVAKRQLEDETITRVDLQNRVQSMKEEMAFNNQVHEQVLNESVHRSRGVQIEQSVDADDGLHESMLTDALQEMREDNDEQLRLMRIEMETVFEKKLAQLRGLEQVDSGTETLHADLRNSRKKIEEMSSELSRLKSQNVSYEMRIRDLEARLKQEQDENQAIRSSLNAEINILRARLDSQLLEYRDLMDVKIQLDVEIAAYRKLLESEESRLSFSEKGASARKRKRVELDEGGSFLSGQNVHHESLSDLKTSSSAIDVVEISETSPDGKFIKLSNTSSDREVSLGGWQLKHFVGDDDTLYKFGRNAVIKPQQCVTIWSTDSGQTHLPPDNLVMKNMKWFAGNISNTVLLDQNGEEKATRETKKSAVRTTVTSAGYHAESSVDAPGQKQASKAKWGWSLFNLMN